MQEIRLLLRETIVELKGLQNNVQNHTELDPNLKVMLSSLCSRIIGDLRCIEREAGKGYIAQAWTLLASAIEAITLLLEACFDPCKAAAWVTFQGSDKPHDRPHQGRVRRVEELYNNLFKDTEEAKSAKAQLDDFYETACNYKHIDPPTQRDVNVVSNHYGAGPDFSEYARSRAILAVAVGVKLGNIVLGIYARQFLPFESAGRVIQKSKSCNDRLGVLLEKYMTDYLQQYPEAFQSHV